MQRAKQISESIELGIILALAGGFMDVYSYIGRDHVFANAQTGNILLVGVSISEGNWALAGRYFFPVVSFAVGIMLADLVHERFGSVIHWRQVTVFFEAVILLGVSFIPGGGYNLLANCLTSFACGMQVESFRKIHGHGIATTMCIGNLRNALQNVDDYIITHKRGFLENGLLYFGVIFTFVFGAVLGNWCIERMGLHAIGERAAVCRVCHHVHRPRARLAFSLEGCGRGLERGLSKVTECGKGTAPLPQYIFISM